MAIEARSTCSPSPRVTESLYFKMSIGKLKTHKYSYRKHKHAKSYLKYIKRTRVHVKHSTVKVYLFDTFYSHTVCDARTAEQMATHTHSHVDQVRHTRRAARISANGLQFGIRVEILTLCVHWVFVFPPDYIFRAYCDRPSVGASARRKDCDLIRRKSLFDSRDDKPCGS